MGESKAFTRRGGYVGRFERLEFGRLVRVARGRRLVGFRLFLF